MKMSDSGNSKSGSSSARPGARDNHSSEPPSLERASQSQASNKRAAEEVSPGDDFDFGDDLDHDIFEEELLSLEKAAVPAPTTGTAIPVALQRPGETGNALAARTTNDASVGHTTFLPKSKSTVVVSSSQRDNPLIKFIRNVPYEYGEIVPDFIVGLTSCVLFLSIRYHRLHPEYIYGRIAALGKSFVLRVLLILVDVDTHQQAIRELSKVAMTNGLTIVCAWSNEEAARYIETFKAYENRPPDSIKERIDDDYLSKLTDSLTQVHSINKTDVVTLGSIFGSFKNIMDASADELGLLPGFGERKVGKLIGAFDQPFMIDPRKRRRK
ncbi:ssDNA endonuclease and repair protein rad10 [Lunasporangiospora selenospora]|uniref:DNA excision repair protein ERCC-1 n=1 Tax=Lunasporangiospora selenospora TaxID=979761 RepID=A0A9P6K9G0_9FUNG|nr:ssDNA endonuclease and repair protein rad10 [Lunasporangiospora selenospora]